MDVVEISSDSEDTIILYQNKEEYLLYNENSCSTSIDSSLTKNAHESVGENLSDRLKPQDFRNDPDDEVLRELYKKYLPCSSSSILKEEQSSSASGVSSENSDQILQELYSKYCFNKNASVSSGSTESSGEEGLLGSLQDEIPLNANLISDDDNATTSYNRALSSEDNLSVTGEVEKKTKKQILEETRKLKGFEREKKKELTERQKALKKLVKEVQKSTTKENCLKNIIVNLDSSVLNEVETAIIESALEEKGISHRPTSNMHGLISWTRKIRTIENMVHKEENSDEKHFLVILPSINFTSLVQANDLMNHIHFLSIQSKFEHLTIVVYGSAKPSEEQEFAIMEVEMFFKCYWQFVKKIEDLASLITIVSKSVAQIPFKLEQQDKSKLQNEYFNDFNKDTVKVDKNGNGLNRLWHQMLTMFPLARLETAEAITAKYPTPFSLFKAYDDCSKKEELIRDLPMRRAVGPLTSARKIGPELSKKFSNFFTSEDNIFI